MIFFFKKKALEKRNKQSWTGSLQTTTRVSLQIQTDFCLWSTWAFIQAHKCSTNMYVLSLQRCLGLCLCVLLDRLFLGTMLSSLGEKINPSGCRALVSLVNVPFACPNPDQVQSKERDNWLRKAFLWNGHEKNLISYLGGWQREMNLILIASLKEDKK